MTLASRLWAVLVVAAATGACRPETPAAKIRQALSLPTAVASPPLGARVESSWRRRDAIVEKVVFDDYNGRPIPALVSYSDLPRERPLPVILFMPGSPNRKEDLVQPRALLPQWAQAGFFVLTIDRPYHGERSGDPEVAVRSKGLPAVLGEYVHDLIRALDYAQTRSEVDASRLGMVGLSMGGMEALLLAAVDERLSCVVSVGGQLSWEDVFTQDTWQLIFSGLPITERLRSEGAGAQTVQSAFLGLMPELAVLDAPFIARSLAPRPLLLMTGAEDPYVTAAATRRTYQAAQDAYGEAGAELIGIWIEAGAGHGFSRQMEERALAWCRRWLEPSASEP